MARRRADDTKTRNVSVYIGPSFQGVVAENTVFSGDVSEGLKRLEEKYPQIKKLIVSLDDFSAARKELQNGGALAEIYKSIRNIT